MLLVPPVDPCRGGRLADTACWRRCHASDLFGCTPRRTSPTGDERHNKRKSGPARVDSVKESQLAAGRDLLLSVGRHRQGESQQQASKRKWRSQSRSHSESSPVEALAANSFTKPQALSRLRANCPSISLSFSMTRTVAMPSLGTEPSPTWISIVSASFSRYRTACAPR